MFGRSNRWLIGGFLLLSACSRQVETHESPENATLYLAQTDGQWVIQSQKFPEEIAKGMLFYIQHHAPLPGSEIQHPIGVARVTGFESHIPQVDLLFTHPQTPPSIAGLNPMVPVEEAVGTRLDNLVGESVDPDALPPHYEQPEAGTVALNIGALDGVFVGAVYTLLDWDDLDRVTTCTIPMDGLFQTHSWCTLESGTADLKHPYFARLAQGEQPIEGLAAIQSVSDPCPTPFAPNAPLNSLSQSQACTLLNRAYLDFSQRFGRQGEGGSDGIYLDQRYKDPNYMPDSLDDDWVVPPERARLALRVQQWLQQPDQKSLVIFGTISSGKGTFAQRAAFDVAVNSLIQGRGLIPVRVNMGRHLGPDENLESVGAVDLIARAMAKTLGTPIVAEDLQADLAAGRILPIFDGFDEVSLNSTVMNAIHHYQKLVENAAPGQGRMILLTRSSHTLGEPLAGLTLAMDQEVQTATDQTQLYLTPLTAEVVDDYLKRLAPDAAIREHTLESIHRAFDIEALARTPILVFLISNYLAHYEGGEMPSDVYSLYRLYVGQWTERVLGRIGVDERGWERFLRRCVAMGLALDQWQQKDISEAELQSFISANGWLLAPLEADDAWKTAVSSASGGAFFSQGTDGRYRFVDRSFQQYFASEGLIQALIFVWRENPEDWTAQFILKQFIGLKPSDGTINFLREGMGPDPMADRGVQFLLENADSARSANAFYQLRLIRQRLVDPAEPARGDVIARRSRFTFNQLYAEEAKALQKAATAGVQNLLADPQGKRYAALPHEPWIVRDIQDDSLWAYIPAGDFYSGHGVDELFTAKVKEPFLLSLFEVTNGEFRDFYFNTPYEPHAFLRTSRSVPFLEHWPTTRFRGVKGRDFPEDLVDHPVTAVSWQDIVAYLNWRNARIDAPKERPPNEFEWELAARGLLGRRYPWGDAFDTLRITVSNDEEGQDFLQKVDSQNPSRSPLGVYHMTGNVQEWVLPGDSDSMEITGTLRGGSNLSTPEQLAIYALPDRAPSGRLRLPDAGFRIRRALPRTLTDPKRKARQGFEDEEP